MSVSKALRYQVLRRDNHACRYCGASAPDVELTVDHVVPTTLGGSDAPENLVTACRPCNSGKSATPPDAAIVDDVEQSALRWAAAMGAARESLRADRQRRDNLLRTFEQTWNRWTSTGEAGHRRTLDLPDSWPTSVDQLANAGLGAEELAEAVDIAMRTEKVKDVFKYFCGVSWRMVEQLQKAARASLDAEAGGAVYPDTVRYDFLTITCPSCKAGTEISLETILDDPDSRWEVIFCGPSIPPRPPVAPDLLRVRDAWLEVAGPDLDTHAKPRDFDNGELLLHTDSSAWATQVQMLARTIARRLNEHLGEDLVQKVTAMKAPAAGGAR